MACVIWNVSRVSEKPGIPGAGADPETAGCVVGVQPEARRPNRGLGARESQGSKAHVMALARAVVDRLLETDILASSEQVECAERGRRVGRVEDESPNHAPGAR